MTDKKNKLTPKQQLFVSEYLKTGNATEAARRAGYKLMDSCPSGYYVYLLIDSSDDSIFYVGKGKGKRAKQHVRDALSGRVCNSAKHDRIIEILSSGFEVSVNFFACGLSEIEAFKVERLLIEQLASSGLTNMVHGVVTFNERLLREVQFRLDHIETKEEFLRMLTPYGRMVTTSAFGSPEQFHDFFVDAHKKIIELLKKEIDGEQQKSCEK